MTFSRRPARGLGAAAATAVAATAALAGPALAAPGGSTTIELKGPAAKALRSQQVTLSAKKPAKAGAKRIVLKAGRVAVSPKSAKLTHRGSVTLRRKSGRRVRTVTLTAWETKVTAKRTTISAKLGRKRLTLFTATAPQRRVTLDATAGTAGMSGATVRLTPAGAKALRAKLALTSLPAARIGAGKVTAATDAGSGGTTPDQCSGFDAGSAPAASAPLTRPLTATVRDVASAPMVWYARDSWIRYMNTPDDGIHIGDGAALGPIENYPDPTDSYSNPALSPRFAYSVYFVPQTAGSWYDPATNTGRFAYTGSVRFAWPSHGIDLTLKDPEIELNGAGSRVVFTVIGAACSNVPAKRIELLKLALQAPVGTSPYTFGSMTATIADGAAQLFSGQYYTGDFWGSVKNLSVTLKP